MAKFLVFAGDSSKYGNFSPYNVIRGEWYSVEATDINQVQSVLEKKVLRDLFFGE
jgi:hypothetical protein